MAAPLRSWQTIRSAYKPLTIRGLQIISCSAVSEKFGQTNVLADSLSRYHLADTYAAYVEHAVTSLDLRQLFPVRFHHVLAVPARSSFHIGYPLLNLGQASHLFSAFHSVFRYFIRRSHRRLTVFAAVPGISWDSRFSWFYQVLHENLFAQLFVVLSVFQV